MPGLGHPPGEGALRRKGSLPVGIRESPWVTSARTCLQPEKSPRPGIFQTIFVTGKKIFKFFFIRNVPEIFHNQKKYKKNQRQNIPKKL
jgi:hypothetical protein